MTYSFAAGPDSQPHTVDTPYSPEAVTLAVEVYGFSLEVLQGVLCMFDVADAAHLELLREAELTPTDGSQGGLTFGEIADSLAHWTAHPVADAREAAAAL